MRLQRRGVGCAATSSSSSSTPESERSRQSQNQSAGHVKCNLAAWWHQEDHSDKRSVEWCALDEHSK
eukprot:2605744-Prymnesium_polylepis.1